MIPQLSVFNGALLFDGPLERLNWRKSPAKKPPLPNEGCVVHVSAAFVCGKFALKFRPTAFVFRGKKAWRQKRSYEEASQNGPCCSRCSRRSRSQPGIKCPSFRGHSFALPDPPNPNQIKACLLIQPLTLLCYSVPAFPLRQRREGVGGCGGGIWSLPEVRLEKKGEGEKEQLH